MGNIIPGYAIAAINFPCEYNLNSIRDEIKLPNGKILHEEFCRNNLLFRRDYSSEHLKRDYTISIIPDDFKEGNPVEMKCLCGINDKKEKNIRAWLKEYGQCQLMVCMWTINGYANNFVEEGHLYFWNDRLKGFDEKISLKYNPECAERYLDNATQVIEQVMALDRRSLPNVIKGIRYGGENLNKTLEILTKQKFERNKKERNINYSEARTISNGNHH